MSSLAECPLLVAHRGDPAYLASPPPGEFAVLDLAEGTRTFYAIPRGSNALDLVLLIEEAFRTPAERIEEFVWAL